MEILSVNLILEESKEAKDYEPNMTPKIEAFLKCINEAYNKKLKAKLNM